MGWERDIKYGIYELYESMPEWEVLNQLRKGAVCARKVTFPEGLRLEEVAKILEKNGIIDEEMFLKAATNKELLSKSNIPFNSFEGFLFPDTYTFFEGSSAEEIIKRMVQRFFEVYRKEFKSSKIPLDTLVILASIVEEEAAVDEERPLIASVYLNRLKKGMLLEADVTVQYALGKHKERLTYNDLKINSPYNTYIHKGLPPGPICSPGKASLLAVVNAPTTPYLYFVARGDRRHIFSKTLEEHLRAKKKVRMQRYGK